MPEVITKYPASLLKTLKDGHITCGIENKPQILTNCPKENFCSSPTGEICVYSIKEINQISQIHALDVFLVPNTILFFIAFSVLVFGIGMITGIKMK